ncbi:uncharacterized protein PRCAT00000284001 [Priceomyces carsonii]|uniref:uncharacterized protein n=1 Tax=Priceomyces carsonii TaxID=28549 RepID=UPI002EDB08CE|nr:unnamed protein product [Priceomyces carsonii]
METLKLDLRFEQSFMKSLYATAGLNNERILVPDSSLTDEELQAAISNIDLEEEKLLSTSGLVPLPQITPSIIAYTVIKDQIIQPLIFGFLWSGFLIMLVPFKGYFYMKGRLFGEYLFSFMPRKEAFYFGSGRK